MGAEENKKEESLFDKIIGFFNKEGVSKDLSIEARSAKAVEYTNIYDDENGTSTSINTDEELSNLELTEENITHIESSLVTSFIDFSSSTVESIKRGGISAIDFAKIKTEQAMQSSTELSFSISNTFVSFSTEIGKKYDNLEIKPKLLSFIYKLDILKVIAFIEITKNNQKLGSQEKNALAVLLSILYLFEKSKSQLSSEKQLINTEGDDLSYDLELLLKSISLKDVVETVEPFLLIIPNGNYILLILKLFI